MSSSNRTTSVLQYTSIDEIPKIRENLKATYNSGRLRPLEYRKQQLLRLVHLLEDNHALFEEAFKVDLGRHALEATAAELNGAVMDLMHLHDNFETWAKPQKPGFNLKFWAFSPVVRRVPKGVVLVVGPFNYPLMSTLCFLGAAIVTGNACVVKMSELTPNVSAALTEIFPRYLDQDLFRVVNGGIPETTAVLQLQWDHIVFTGSPAVARIIATAAAKHLTPTTLELGGQCPVFCDPNMDMYLTAKRLLWSKALNAGQTCTTVNHIFVPHGAQDALAEAFSKVYKEFFPEGPERAPISTLVTDVAFKRIEGLLEKTKGEIVCGGQSDEGRRWIAPTILKNVALDDVVMESELFGPILPIVPVRDLQDAIDWTNSRAHPLAVYAFTDDPKFKEYVFGNTHSGQFIVNDTNIQATIPILPFGGVGESGYGMVKGRYVFDTLSHLRATCESPRFVDMIMGWRFPPYTDAKVKQAAALKPRIPPLNPGWGSYRQIKGQALLGVHRARDIKRTAGFLVAKDLSNSVLCHLKQKTQMTSSSAATPVLQYTSLNDIPKIREHLKATFSSGRLRSVRYRRQQLLGLVHLIEDNSARFEEAFKLDLGRHNLETTAADVNGTVTELMYLYDNFGAWTKPEKPPFNLKFWALSPVIRRVPKGVVLVIGPFNYPVASTLSFLGAAIATGNACVVKMSELTPNVAAVVTELLPKYLDQDLFRIVNGGILETTAILELQWDHIVFTGSPAVGRVVATAAAKHLTPTTLELGGQCPVFCDPKMDMYLTAKRLLWSKAFNAGQTCTAVNHIFVPFAAQDALVAAFVKAYNEFYPEGADKAPISSLVTDVAFKRVKGLLEKTKGEVVCGGQLDEKRRFIAPTVLKNVALDDIVMENELFGPILPIVPVKSMQDAIDWTNSRPHPLAVYAFTNDSKFKKYIFNNTQSGQFVVNDTGIQAAIQTLPFGGVGESGYGMVKGKYIIDTLSHLRATCKSPRFVDSMMGWRFPPYSDDKIKQISALKPKIPPLNPGWGGRLRSWMPF